MTEPDDLPEMTTASVSVLLERIEAGVATDADRSTLRQLLLAAPQRLTQFGKYNIQIGEGQHIQIGGRTYVDINDAAIQAIVQAIQQAVKAAVPQVQQTVSGNQKQVIAKMTGGTAIANVETLILHPPAPETAPPLKTFFDVPYPRNPFFTGREELLNDLHTVLTERGRAAFSGLGGMGKTQTALEYVYRHQREYDYIFWVRAEQTEELIAGYAAVAKAIQLPGWQQDDQLAVANLMKQWMTTQDRWLLVLDNADDLAQVRPFLPSANGHILMTTRAQAVGDLAQKLEVRKMSPDEGTLFLLRRAKVIGEKAELGAAAEADQAFAHTLTAEMDGLPLALDQAGAYIEEQSLSLGEYLELFETEKAELLRERGQLNPDHPSVTVTFTLAFAKVAQNPVAADLLRVCTFLSADAIPEEIFSEGGEYLGENLSAAAKSKLALSKAISDAARFSLISRNPGNRTLTIHRLVQTVLREEMDKESQRQWVERVVEAVTQVFPNAEFENWSPCKRLFPDAQTVCQWVQNERLESESAALLLSRTGYYLHERVRYSEAEPLFQQALAMRQQLLGDDHPDVANSLNYLALLYCDQGRYEEAEPLFQQALAMRQQLLGDDHPDVAHSLNYLAGLYWHQGRYEEAEPLFQQALAMRQQLLGDDHPDVAHSLNNLALLYRNQERYSEAEPLFQQALATYQRLLGDDHPNVAHSLNNLAGLYHDQGRYSEAEPLFQQALATYQRLLGDDHPDFAHSLKNLARLYHDQWRYSEAEPLFQQALTIAECQLGPHHPLTEKIRQNYVKCQQAMQAANDSE